jgi:hypothetical protein
MGRRIMIKFIRINCPGCNEDHEGYLKNNKFYCTNCSPAGYLDEVKTDYIKQEAEKATQKKNRIRKLQKQKENVQNRLEIAYAKKRIIFCILGFIGVITPPILFSKYPDLQEEHYLMCIISVIGIFTLTPFSAFILIQYLFTSYTRFKIRQGKRFREQCRKEYENKLINDFICPRCNGDLIFLPNSDSGFFAFGAVWFVLLASLLHLASKKPDEFICRKCKSTWSKT